jgi:hypothetical protein
MDGFGFGIVDPIVNACLFADPAAAGDFPDYRRDGRRLAMVR